MEEPLQVQEPSTDTPPPPGMSLWGRLFNVFATPGEVFQEVKTAKDSAANWLVPALILILVSWAGGVLIFSQDSIKHQFSDIVDQSIQKQVQSHRLTEQQAEQGRAVGEKWANIIAKISTGVLPVLVGFLSPFFWGLIIWVVGSKVLKGGFPFMKAVEVVGLGNMILVLDAVVKTLLIVGLGNLYASPSLFFLAKDFDPQNTVHSLLTIVNVMTFWVLTLRAIGLARLSGTSLAKAMLWVFGIWAAYTGFFVGLGLLAKMFFKRMGAG
jgi:hypothetical protein